MGVNDASRIIINSESPVSGATTWSETLESLITILEASFNNRYIFMQLTFNLSNAVTDTLESSTILIYSAEHISLYTKSLGRLPYWLNGSLKVIEQGAAGLWIKSAVAKEVTNKVYNKIFCENTKICSFCDALVTYFWCCLRSLTIFPHSEQLTWVLLWHRRLWSTFCRRVAKVLPQTSHLTSLLLPVTLATEFGCHKNLEN